MTFTIFDYTYLVNWLTNSLPSCHPAVFWCHKGYNSVRRLTKTIMHNNSILLFELSLSNATKRVLFSGQMKLNMSHRESTTI